MSARDSPIIDEGTLLKQSTPRLRRSPQQQSAGTSNSRSSPSSRSRSSFTSITPIQGGVSDESSPSSMPRDSPNKVQSSTSQSSGSSSQSFKIATEHDGERQMTQTELNTMVSKALSKARKATTPKRRTFTRIDNPPTLRMQTGDDKYSPTPESPKVTELNSTDKQVKKSPTQELDDILQDDAAMRDMLSVSPAAEDDDVSQHDDDVDATSEISGFQAARDMMLDDEFGSPKVAIHYAPPPLKDDKIANSASSAKSNSGAVSTPVTTKSQSEKGQESRHAFYDVNGEADNKAVVQKQSSSVKGADSTASEYTEETVTDDEHGRVDSQYTEETVTDREGSTAAEEEGENGSAPAASPKKNLWWTATEEELAKGALNDEEPKVEEKSHPAVSHNESISQNGSIDNEVAAATQQAHAPVSALQPPAPVMATWERSPSPQIMRVAEPESRRDESPSRAASKPVGNEEQRVLGNTAQIEFRHPYPLPPPVPKPRSSMELIKDHSLGEPEPFKHWSKPKPDLEKLFDATMGSSLPRRSNACGALKVLSLKPKNQMTLVRTRGFLDALVFAMRTDIPETIEHDIALDARGRAVTTLLNVLEQKENRSFVMAHPGVGDALVKVIQEDVGEARVHAVAAVATLSKTKVNRESLVKVEGLREVLGLALRGTIDENRTLPTLPLLRAETEEVEPDDHEEEEESDEEGSHAGLHNGGFGTSSFDSGAPSDDEDASHDEHGSHGSLSSSSSVAPSPPASPSSVGDRTVSIKRQKHEKYDEYLVKVRVNACAALSHLSKQCAISDQLADHEVLLHSIIHVCCEFSNAIHTKCLEIICNLSRFPSNNAAMARNDHLVDTLVKCGKSKNLEDRVWALRTFQNMTSDSTSKVILASRPILTLFSISSMRKDYDEQVAAVAALYNISTEPGAVVPLTNTRNVVATLVHLAHNVTLTPEVRRMACDALATIGLWLQTLAGAGVVPDGVTKVLLPSHTTTGWQRWD